MTRTEYYGSKVTLEMTREESGWLILYLGKLIVCLGESDPEGCERIIGFMNGLMGSKG